MYIQIESENVGYKVYPKYKDEVLSILSKEKINIQIGGKILMAQRFACGWIAHLICEKGENSPELEELRIEESILQHAKAICERHKAKN